MASKKIDRFPPLRRPSQKAADPGKVRLGDAWITAEFPRLGLSRKKVADPGKVRLGDAWITAEFPPRK